MIKRKRKEDKRGEKGEIGKKRGNNLRKMIEGREGKEDKRGENGVMRKERKND